MIKLAQTYQFTMSSSTEHCDNALQSLLCFLDKTEVIGDNGGNSKWSSDKMSERLWKFLLY